jgi:hypothetical protein
MPEAVKVEDFEAFRTLRAALLKFAQAADNALANVDSQIARTHQWLESEQASYWHGQLRKRSEMVTKAREAVRQKKLYKDSSGRIPGAIEEEKFLAKCVAAVNEAESKLLAVKRSLPRLEKARDGYRGGVAALGRDVGGEIPKAVALLDRLALSLEQYAQIDVPETAAPEPLSTGGEAMARGGTETAAIPQTPPPAPVPEPAAEPLKEEERPHVADGQ